MVEAQQEYFSRPDTPAADSPVGALMVRILEKSPNMQFEEARAKANALLGKAAGRWNYTTPRVLSPEQQARQKERLKATFTTLDKAA